MLKTIKHNKNIKKTAGMNFSRGSLSAIIPKFWFLLTKYPDFLKNLRQLCHRHFSYLLIKHQKAQKRFGTEIVIFMSV